MVVTLQSGFTGCETIAGFFTSIVRTPNDIKSLKSAAWKKRPETSDAKECAGFEIAIASWCNSNGCSAG